MAKVNEPTHLESSAYALSPSFLTHIAILTGVYTVLAQYLRLGNQASVAPLRMGVFVVGQGLDRVKNFWVIDLRRNKCLDNEFIPAWSIFQPAVIDLIVCVQWQAHCASHGMALSQIPHSLSGFFISVTLCIVSAKTIRFFP